MDKRTCDACGQDGLLADFQIANREFRLCGRKVGHTIVPRAACRSRLVKSSHLCPGCGEEMDARDHAGKVCTACRRRLDERPSTDEPTVWVQVRGDMLRSYLGYEERRQLATALSIAVSASSRRDPIWLAAPAIGHANPNAGHSGEDEVLVTEEQVRALREVERLFKLAVETAYLEGQRRGRSMLLQLAGGEMAVHDFSRRDEEMAAKIQAREQSKDR